MRAFGSMEIWDHKRLQARKGRLNSLGADMQQPTECRKDEGTRVRRLAPKLIANGESRRPLRERQPSSGSQDLAVTWQ